mgnify:CR=1 FL=1
MNAKTIKTVRRFVAATPKADRAPLLRAVREELAALDHRRRGRRLAQLRRTLAGVSPLHLQGASWPGSFARRIYGATVEALTAAAERTAGHKGKRP